MCRILLGMTRQAALVFMGVVITNIPRQVAIRWVKRRIILILKEIRLGIILDIRLFEIYRSIFPIPKRYGVF